MRRAKAAARRRRVPALARRPSGLDALLIGVVLATAAGFRFLAERHFQDAAHFGTAELVVAMEVVLIPLALAAMVVASRGQGWRELGLAPRIGGAVGALAVLAAGFGLILLPSSPPDPFGSPAMALATAPLAVAEELLRRAFLLNELAALFGGGRRAKGAAVGTLGLAEALSYSPAGAPAAISAGGADLVLGAAYLAAGHSLLGPLTARVLAYAGSRAGIGG